MLFNTINFGLFLPIVFCIYWLLNNKALTNQNLLLLLSSYFFYACWDYRFLFLLVFSTLLDYFTAIKISESKNENQKKFYFLLSILANLGFLGFFKYYNFFAGSLQTMLGVVGIKSDMRTLNIILPVGISFYTFHGLSYIIDIYKERLKPVKNFIDYSVFVSFFPLLIAGPIERAHHLLPQIQNTRKFEYSRAVDGLRQILWGLFKKVVVADTCAGYANMAFNYPEAVSGSSHVLGAIFFSFQIYGDFSGYSDIALGTARLFGIELLRNFAFPYFSRDIAEFWRRWHISLSSWFKDYVYIPLGGSKVGTLKNVRNVFIIFLLSGFWHGANWTFIAWGALNAIYFLPLLLFNKNRNNIEIVALGKSLPSFKEMLSILVTFSLTVFAWIFFRSDSIGGAFVYISEIFSKSLFAVPELPSKALLIILIISFTMTVEWVGRANQYALAGIGLTWPKSCRLILYYALALAIFYFSGSDEQFIYFQF